MFDMIEDLNTRPLAARLAKQVLLLARSYGVQEGDEIRFVVPVKDGQLAGVAAKSGHALVIEANEVNELSGAGRGVTFIKLDDDDEVIALRVPGTILGVVILGLVSQSTLLVAVGAEQPGTQARRPDIPRCRTCRSRPRPATQRTGKTRHRGRAETRGETRGA